MEIYGNMATTIFKILFVIAVGYIFYVVFFKNKKEESSPADLYNAQGFDKFGIDKYGRDMEGRDYQGYDMYGYNASGYDINGHGINGHDINGYDNQGYEFNESDSSDLYNDNY